MVVIKAINGTVQRPQGYRLVLNVYNVLLVTRAKCQNVHSLTKLSVCLSFQATILWTEEDLKFPRSCIKHCFVMVLH